MKEQVIFIRDVPVLHVAVGIIIVVDALIMVVPVLRLVYLVMTIDDSLRNL